MSKNDYSTIFQWHPELILVSENPVTWQGFLVITPQSSLGENTRVRLKLTAPNFPLLKNAEINFGRKIAFLNNREFCEKLKTVIHSIQSVSAFLKQLQLLINNFIDIRCNVPSKVINSSVSNVLQELNDTFLDPCEVKLSSSKNLETIKLSIRNVSVILQRDDCDTISSWKVLSSDLPKISNNDIFDKITSINIARHKFKLNVDIFERTWSILERIDNNCWVVDPLDPKPYHLYRRIYLTESLSVLVTINPLDPTNLPDIKFLGSDVAVERQREIVSRHLNEWNPENNFLLNLMTLLDIFEFPQKRFKTLEHAGGIVADRECCICYILELDHGVLPDKVCNNEKCKRYFHTVCLLQWLQSVAGNQIVFNHIHGACPHCGEVISCLIG